MRKTTLSRRLLTVVLGLSAAALFVATALVHYHGNSSASHPDTACRACRLQEGFAATPAAPALATARPAPVETRALCPSQVPRAAVVLRSASSRAPPALS